MNKDKWNSLPKDIQGTIEAINKEWVGKYGDAWEKSDAEGREFTLSLGNKIIPLSPEEIVRWANAVAPVVDDYVKDVPLELIFKGVLPMLLALLICNLCILIFPQIALFLPDLMR